MRIGIRYPQYYLCMGVSRIRNLVTPLIQPVLSSIPLDIGMQVFSLCPVFQQVYQRDCVDLDGFSDYQNGGFTVKNLTQASNCFSWLQGIIPSGHDHFPS